MSSKAVARISEKPGRDTTGHEDYKPRSTRSLENGGGMDTVRINGEKGGGFVAFGGGPAGKGSQWEHHPGKDHSRAEPYDRTNNISWASGSESSPIAVIGDRVESDAIAVGSPNVFAGANVYVGSNTGVDLDIPSVAAIVEGDDVDIEEPGSGYAYVQKQIDAGRISTDDIKKQALLNKTAEDTSPAKPPGPLSSSCADIASITPFPTGNAIDDIKLSLNYTIGKLTRAPNVTFDHPLRTGQVGLSVEEICCNLKLLAVNCIEPIRAQYATAFVTNTFRRGDSKSQHNKGQAADIQFRGLAKAQYFTVAQWIRDNVSYDQLLLEYKTTGTGLPWIHISFSKDRQRKQVLTFLNDRTYGQGLIQLA